jgi:hypothetical protein
MMMMMMIIIIIIIISGMTSLYETQPSLEVFFFWISEQDFYGVGLSTSRPTPNLEDQAFVLMPPGVG